jgi:hypothetical protein
VKRGGAEIYVLLCGINKSIESLKKYTIKDITIAQKVLCDELIVGIRESDLRFIGKNWRPLHAVLQEKVSEIKKINDTEYILANIESIKHSSFEDKIMDAFAKIKPELHDDSPVYKYITEFEFVKELSDESVDMINLINLVDGEKNHNEIKTKDTVLSKLHDLITNRYAMFDFIDFWKMHYNYDGYKALAKYINAVDAMDGLDISLDVVKLAG